MSRRLSTRQQQNSQKKGPELEPAAAADEHDLAAGLCQPKPLNHVGVKSFCTQEQRTKSFVITAARKRQSSAKKGAKIQKWNWPADHPAPAIMARAGFYFKPAQGDEDNVACFVCQKNMSEWDPDDDPAEQHLRHNSSCGWALTMCRDLVVNGKILCDPLGEEMCRARRMTFDNWWPHEGKKGWKPNVENVVMAGFIFRPQKDGDDTVYCPYCKLSIDAWERDDDPRQTHGNLGSGGCSFIKHITATSRATDKDSQKATVGISIGGAKESAGLKKKPSRTRKINSNTQRKKTTPRDQLPAKEHTKKVCDGEEVRCHDIQPVALVERKQDNQGMEEGKGAHPSLALENTLQPSQTGQQSLEIGKSPGRSQSKRRVTRASVVNNQSDLGLVAAVPARAPNPGDIVAVPVMESVHITPIKPKGKIKKNSAIPSSTLTGRGKPGKQNKLKPRLSLSEMDDDEIDQALEREIMDDGSSAVDTDPEAEYHQIGIAAGYTNSETTQSPKPNEHKIAKPQLPKDMRMFTRTKPTRRSSTPESLEQGNDPKPRRKRLTRTKPATRISAERQATPEVNAVETSQPSHSAPKTASSHSDVLVAPINDLQGSNKESSLISPSRLPSNKPNLSSPPASTLIQAAGSLPPSPAGPHPIPGDTDWSLFRHESPLKSETDQRTRQLSPNPNAQSQVAQIASVSRPREKDMKRKSDVVIDVKEEHGRGGKKRKTTVIRSAATPKQYGLEESVVITETPLRKFTRHPSASGAADDQASDELQRPQLKFSGNPSQLIEDSILRTMRGPGNEDFPGMARTPAHDGPKFDETTQEGLEEEDTIYDTSFEHGGIAPIKRLVLEDNTIDAILSVYERPPETGAPGLAQMSRIAPPPNPEHTLIPDSPIDDASQDSIPNTQFSALASQMTVATSFQGSNKGVSFVSTAEEQFGGGQGALFALGTRTRSPTISPKPKILRTPLSVVSKGHNRALALMTPRDRAEEIAFEPVRSLKPWRSVDIEAYIDELKENMELAANPTGLPAPERDLAISEWIAGVAQKAEKRLIRKGELLVKFFEEEAERAVATIEAIEAE